MKKHTLFFLVLLLSLSGISFLNAQTSNDVLLKKKYNANKAMEDENGYTQAILVGNTLYISGTVGWGKMQDAIKLAYDGINSTLSAHNANFSNVVKENIFTTQIDSLIKYKTIRNEYYKNEFPVASWVEVRRLFTPEIVIEVEIVAELPKKKKKE